jgi:hypothetical protein
MFVNIHRFGHAVLGAPPPPDSDDLISVRLVVPPFMEYVIARLLDYLVNAAYISIIRPSYFVMRSEWLRVYKIMSSYLDSPNYESKSRGQHDRLWIIPCAY